MIQGLIRICWLLIVGRLTWDLLDVRIVKHETRQTFDLKDMRPSSISLSTHQSWSRGRRGCPGGHGWTCDRVARAEGRWQPCTGDCCYDIGPRTRDLTSPSDVFTVWTAAHLLWREYTFLHPAGRSGASWWEASCSRLQSSRRFTEQGDAAWGRSAPASLLNREFCLMMLLLLAYFVCIMQVHYFNFANISKNLNSFVYKPTVVYHHQFN